MKKLVLMMLIALMVSGCSGNKAEKVVEKYVVENYKTKTIQLMTEREDFGVYAFRKDNQTHYLAYVTLSDGKVELLSVPRVIGIDVINHINKGVITTPKEMVEDIQRTDKMLSMATKVMVDYMVVPKNPDIARAIEPNYKNYYSLKMEMATLQESKYPALYKFVENELNIFASHYKV